MRSVRLAAAALFATAAFAAVPAQAFTATGSFQVNATVVSACTVSGSLLNFGNSIDPLSAGVPLDATSALTVQCTNTTPYSVSLNAGANTQIASTQRSGVNQPAVGKRSTYPASSAVHSAPSGAMASPWGSLPAGRSIVVTSPSAFTRAS